MNILKSIFSRKYRGNYILTHQDRINVMYGYFVFFHGHGYFKEAGSTGRHRVYDFVPDLKMKELSEKNRIRVYDQYGVAYDFPLYNAADIMVAHSAKVKLASLAYYN